MSDQEGMDTSPHFSSVVSLVLHHDVYIMLASVSITRFSYVFVEVCFSPCWSSAIVSTQTTTNHETILKRSTQQWSTHWKYRDEGSFVVIFAPTPQLMQLQATPPSPKPETVIVMGLQCSQHAIAEHRRACHVDHGICNCTFCMEYYGIMITISLQHRKQIVLSADVQQEGHADLVPWVNPLTGSVGEFVVRLKDLKARHESSADLRWSTDCTNIFICFHYFAL